MGVVLNNEVKSIAFIKSQIYDQGEISGNFTKEQGEDLALDAAVRSASRANRISGRAHGWTQPRALIPFVQASGPRCWA